MNKHLWELLKINYIFMLLMLVASILAVLFLDQTLAYSAHQLGFDKILWLDHFTENSPQLLTACGLYLIFTQLPNFKWQDKLLLLVGMAVILVITLECKDLLKCLLGRNWPAFWLGIHNPLASPYANRYGFHLSLSSKWQGSMPSGHTSFIGGLSMMLWLLVPKARKYIIIFCTLLVIALVMLNHHYFGDCLAGFTLAALMNPLFIGYCFFLCKRNTNSLPDCVAHKTLENKV